MDSRRLRGEPPILLTLKALSQKQISNFLYISTHYPLPMTKPTLEIYSQIKNKLKTIFDKRPLTFDLDKEEHRLLTILLDICQAFPDMRTVNGEVVTSSEVQRWCINLTSFFKKYYNNETIYPDE